MSRFDAALSNIVVYFGRNLHWIDSDFDYYSFDRLVNPNIHYCFGFSIVSCTSHHSSTDRALLPSLIVKLPRDCFLRYFGCSSSIT